MNAFRMLPLALVLALLAGCGNKGPLVLPTAPADAEGAPATDAPAEPAPAESTPTDPAPAESTEPVDGSEGSGSDAAPIEPPPAGSGGGAADDDGHG